MQIYLRGLHVAAAVIAFPAFSFLNMNVHDSLQVEDVAQALAGMRSDAHGKVESFLKKSGPSLLLIKRALTLYRYPSGMSEKLEKELVTGRVWVNFAQCRTRIHK